MNKKAKIGLLLLGLIFIFSIPELIYKNKGKSKSIGKIGSGKLENAWLIPYSGENFKYFSFISYYLMKNGYLHSKVHDTLLGAYKICEKTCPETYFRLMECANKKGGKMAIHNTHQNGMSVDFMVPKIKNGKPSRMGSNPIFTSRSTRIASISTIRWWSFRKFGFERFIPKSNH